MWTFLLGVYIGGFLMNLIVEELNVNFWRDIIGYYPESRLSKVLTTIFYPLPLAWISMLFLISIAIPLYDLFYEKYEKVGRRFLKSR